MNALVIGGGAREHAIAKEIKSSDTNIKLYAIMKNKNPGIARLCEETLLGLETDVEKVSLYAKMKGIELAFIGPEAPLEAGIVDELEKRGIKAVGPKKDAAEIETSKVFARNLMKKYGLGSIEYHVFDNIDDVREFIHNYDKEVVVKPAGLTGGKGVKIVGEQLLSKEDVISYARQIIERKIGGKSELIIEEKLCGEEFTLQAFCDGKNIFPMPAVHDHKRAYENDEGPNTGGMGSYSQADGLLPFLKKDEYEKAVDIMKKTVEALEKEGKKFKGILYGQFMLTCDGVKLIEYNARFGDPEAMNVLSIFKGDFIEVCYGIVDGSLSKKCIDFEKKATVCKYVVPFGYGTDPIAGTPISIDEKNIENCGAKLYYASVDEGEEGVVYTTHSRALGIVGVDDEIELAERKVESALEYVKGNVYVRHDIGKKNGIEMAVKRMEEIRKGLGIKK
ncbi:MAG: phosphoribosylamine--glycine ligase [Candidatus Thermoplasmatota archaeon]